MTGSRGEDAEGVPADVGGDEFGGEEVDEVGQGCDLVLFCEGGRGGGGGVGEGFEFNQKISSLRLFSVRSV